MSKETPAAVDVPILHEHEPARAELEHGQQAETEEPEENHGLWRDFKERAKTLKTDIVESKRYKKTVNFLGEAAIQTIGLPKAAAISAIYNSAQQNVSELSRAVKTDITKSENERITKASALGAISVQAIGLTRLATIMVPYSSIKTLEATGNPLKSAVVTAALFGTWSTVVGLTVNNAVNRLPRTIDTAGNNFPFIFEKFSQSLPAYKSTNQNQQDTSRIPKTRTFGHFVSRQVRRGLSVLGIGLSPYIYTAGVEDRSKKDRSALRNKLIANGTLAAGAASFAIASTIEKIDAKEHYPKIVAGTVGFLFLSEYLKSKRYVNKRQKQNANTSEI